MTTISLATVKPLAPRTPSPTESRGDAGAFRNGLLLMPDEARHIDARFSEVRELLVRIDTKLDGVTKKSEDHESRLRELEERAPAGLKEQVDSLRQWRAQVIGAGLLLSPLTAAVTTILLGHLK